MELFWLLFLCLGYPVLGAVSGRYVWNRTRPKVYPIYCDDRDYHERTNGHQPNCSLPIPEDEIGGLILAAVFIPVIFWAVMLGTAAFTGGFALLTYERKHKKPPKLSPEEKKYAEYLDERKALTSGTKTPVVEDLTSKGRVVKGRGLFDDYGV